MNIHETLARLLFAEIKPELKGWQPTLLKGEGRELQTTMCGYTVYMEYNASLDYHVARRETRDTPEETEFQESYEVLTFRLTLQTDQMIGELFFSFNEEYLCKIQKLINPIIVD